MLALRARGFKSMGQNPDYTYFGGNSELRGYEYLQFIGQQAFFMNAELRFPLIDAMATPIGVLGGIRATLFAGVGGARLGGRAVHLLQQQGQRRDADPRLQPRWQPGLGQPRLIEGARLVDARASYGISLATFALGFPLHFDWSWKTLMNREWEDCAVRLRYGRQRRIPQGEVHDVDWLRLVTAPRVQGFKVSRVLSVHSRENLFHYGFAMKAKRWQDSAAETVQVVLPNDSNPLGFILGGTVMHLIDITGAIACHRHTNTLALTAGVDSLDFIHPIKVGDLIILKSRVTCAFKTSLEVEVEVFSETIQVASASSPAAPT